MILQGLFDVSLRNFLPAQSVSYQPFWTQTQFDNRILDVNKAVGTTPGTATVSLQGSAQYSIPIYIPPGTNGMQPTLALVYDSNGGNGLLGQGWSLAGLSSIERVKKDILRDSKAGSINFNETDGLSLDGNRILKIGSGNQYFAEEENYEKITLYNDLGPNQMSSYFIVEDKDGIRREYGNSLDSRFHNSYNKVQKWALSKKIDTYGNYITYMYTLVNDEFKVSEITYTGNAAAGLAPFCKIKFFYGGRNDKNIQSIGETNGAVGFTQNRVSLITKITITVDQGTPSEDVIKQYDLKYSYDSFRSFLTEIIETGDDEVKKYNSTIFKYDDYIPTLSMNGIYSIPVSSTAVSHDYLAGDFTGDGLSDIVVGYKNSNGKMVEIKLFKNNGANGYVNTINIPIAESSGLVLNLQPFNLIPSDFNGDIRQDLLLYKLISSGPTTTPEIAEVSIIYFSANGTSSQSQVIANDQNLPLVGPLWQGPAFMKCADYDGDSKTDVLFVSFGTIYADFSGDTQGLRQYQLTSHLNFQFNFMVADTKNAIVDQNGDGKAEIIYCAGNEVFGLYDQISTQKIFFDENYNIVETTTSDPSLSPYTYGEDSNFIISDFNGDGKSDAYKSLSQRIECMGGGNVPCEFTTPFMWEPGYTLVPTHIIKFADFNGDGLNDIVRFSNYRLTDGGSLPSFSKIRIQFYLNRGICGIYSCSFSDAFTSLEYSLPNNNSSVMQTILTEDVDGDGKDDLIVLNLDSGHKVIKISPNKNSALMTGVKNGMNVPVNFNYGSLAKDAGLSSNTYFTDNLPNISNNSTNTYPTVVFSTPNFVVTSKSTIDGIGGINTTNYKYSEARANVTGRGFLGFKEVKIEDNATGLRQILLNELNTSFHLYIPKEDKRQLISNNSNIESIYNTNVVTSLDGGKRFKKSISSIQRLDNLSGVYNTNYFTYNANGNVLTDQLTYSNGIESKTVNYTYVNASTWLANKPHTITTTTSRGVEPAVSHSVAYFYHPDGKIDNFVDWVGTTKAVRTRYVYQNAAAIGLPNKIEVSQGISSPTLPIRKEVYNYNSKGFVISKGRYQGAVAYWEYMDYIDDATGKSTEKWGKIADETSVDGLKTKYEYDQYGTLVKTTFPNGSFVINSFNYENPQIIQNNNFETSATNLFFRKSVSHYCAPEKTYYYDQLGRVRKVRNELMGGGYNNIIYSYDKAGRNVSETYPFLDTPEDPILVIKREFDSYGRPISESKQAAGSPQFSHGLVSISYSYSNGNLTKNETIVDPLGEVNLSSKSTIYDEAGKMISASDGGGTTNYSYNSWGQVKDVTFPSNASNPLLNRNIYDSWGRKSQMIDKDGGTVNYVYNAYGELSQLTDANGKVFTYYYDQLGRDSLKVGPAVEGTIKYDYYTTSNLGTATTGSLGKLIKKSLIVNGIQQTSSEYKFTAMGMLRENKEGLLDGTTYTYSTFTYDYNDGEATDNGNCGRLRKTTFPSGLEVYRSYDSESFLNKIELPGSAGLITVYSNAVQEASGKIKSYKLGNGLTTSLNFDYGLPVSVATPNILSLAYDWNYPTRNLMSRSENGVTEFFQYDNVDRLDNIDGPSTNDININFQNSSNSNISFKTDAGTLSYSSTKPHAIISATNPTGSISATNLLISYNSFQQPIQINRSAPNIIYGSVNFMYDHNQQRRKVQTTDGLNNVIKVNKYFGDYEILSTRTCSPCSAWTVKEIHYIASDAGLSIIAVKTGFSFAYYYVYTDYLGSILKVTDATGTIVGNQSFDAWGRNRNPSDFTYSSIPVTPDWLYRGYSGHEHLKSEGIINMNGRLYDPILGRMLSPDNFASDITSSQAFNRYTYANNNPLKYVDPSGETAQPANTFTLSIHDGSFYLGDIAISNEIAFDMISQYASSSESGDGSEVAEVMISIGNEDMHYALDPSSPNNTGFAYVSVNFSNYTSNNNHAAHDPLTTFQHSVTAGTVFFWDSVTEISEFAEGHSGYVKGLKKVAGRLAIVEVGLAVAQVAKNRHDPNIKGIVAKQALNAAVAIGVTLGPAGWVVGAVYFVGDTQGWWGDWGEPTVPVSLDANHH